MPSAQMSALALQHAAVRTVGGVCDEVKAKHLKWLPLTRSGEKYLQIVTLLPVIPYDLEYIVWPMESRLTP
jgi:hypothetical protein